MEREAAGHRVDLVARLTAACTAEIADRDPSAAIPWPQIPTVAAMAVHLGGVHRWAAEIVRTTRRVAQVEVPDLPPGALHTWLEEGRTVLLEALTATPPTTPCWVLGNRTGTVGFWQRRMVFENAKHLIDLRAAGGGTWTAAAELEPDDYADGVDELLTEFLPRSRSALAPLPGSVDLQATDSAHAWRIDPDWTLARDTARVGAGVRLAARASDLALMLWERADLLLPDERITIDGDRATLAALQSTSVHPW